MNKEEAYQAMCQGHKVCNQYYTPEEYAFINPETGLIEYEDGCVVGDRFSANWVKYQDPENTFEWSICDDRGHTINPAFVEPTMTLVNTFERIPHYESPRFFERTNHLFFSKNSHKQTNKRRK